MRGFRLYHINLQPGGWGDWGGMNAWKATFHLVVAHPPNDGGSKWIYECANLPANEEDVGTPYIFVPSSRGHAELSDEAVLSNKWVLGYVVGGNAHFCEMVILDQKMRGRRRSVLGTTPEQVVAKRSQKCYLMPGFEAWHNARDIDDPVDCVAESMGFPVVDIDASLDLENLANVKSAMANNQEAMVDGLETLTLQMNTAVAHNRGQLTEVDIQKRFFAHYDQIRVRVEKKHATLMDKELARMGYLSQGSGQGTC